MSNAAFTDFDSLLNSSMDDLDDLPPVGVPPTGHYTLVVSAERVTPTEAGKNEYIKFSYEVEAINEVKTPEEESQAAAGMKFSQTFSPFKNPSWLASCSPVPPATSPPTPGSPFTRPGSTWSASTPIAARTCPASTPTRSSRSAGTARCSARRGV